MPFSREEGWLRSGSLKLNVPRTTWLLNGGDTHCPSEIVRERKETNDESVVM